MKKVFLPLIAAFALSASAQLIPNSFNYQGVIDKTNAKVVATFELVDAEGNVVYSEDQVVVTNAAGAFTAVVGKGELWNTAWMFSEPQAYTLKAIIDGKEVNCPLNAVPYANVAASYVGQDEIEQTLLEFTEDNMSNKAAIAQLQEDVKANTTELSEVQADFITLQETLAAECATAEDIAAVQESVDALQAEFAELADVNNPESVLSRINAGMGELQEQINTIVDDENGLIANVNLGLTQLNNVVNGNYAEFEAFKADVDNAMENIQMLGNYVMGEEEGSVTSQLEALKADIANLQEQINALNQQ